MTEEEKKKNILNIINNSTVWIDEVEHGIIELKVIPGEYSNEKDLNFTWKVTDFTKE